ncbi:hypothetical protein PAEPH01_1398, partial [Pancytospora epiphaga]
MIEFLSLQNSWLRTFNGGEDPREYLDEINLYRGRLPESQLMDAIRVSLQGKALLWFRAFDGNLIRSVDDFITLFKENFVKERQRSNVAQFFTALLRGRQGSTWEEFGYRLVELGAKARLNPKEAIVDLRSMVPERYQDKLEQVTTWLESTKVFQTIRENSEARGQRPARKIVTVQGDEALKKPDLRKCFICKTSGHFKRDCPRRAGNSAEAPVEAAKAGTSDSPKEENKLTRRGYSCFVLEKGVDLLTIGLRIAGQDESQNAAVDTGASLNFVSLGYCKRKNLRYDAVENKVNTATGEGDIVGELRLKVRIGDTEWDVTFQVVKDLIHDVILGRQFLRESKADISFSKRTVTIHEGEDPFRPDAADEMEIRTEDSTETENLLEDYWKRYTEASEELRKDYI